MTFRSRAVDWEETIHEAGREKAADPQQETSKCPISFMS